ncbi:monooxygenase involved in coenzyme Q (ubiquinone) biosynthesis [Aspergillus oryzae 3.042]|uniref:Monooxygenase involved in coenzyme Q (Ubiquinone) biosynthesis n=1 Tax=Aspergillus oryzae (strain 3.042) TaxID=1160506 RepID=I8A301_ASPO3|nr:monooxygenase involved in coenzyme Q (ubiquinone) biosynthesis [Aspergillus oryzae 3.042]|eukprot:EIT79297.1 monooxygenase involved in coenzyme Q (ubiquinone) biosynthesis [Aspergillus oryzae 3.042]
MGRRNRFPHNFRLVRGYLPVRESPHSRDNDGKRQSRPRTSVAHRGIWRREHLNLLEHNRLIYRKRYGPPGRTGPISLACSLPRSKRHSTVATPHSDRRKTTSWCGRYQQPVRRFADIATEGWDYNRHGVVATLSLADPDQVSFPIGTRTAYQRFLPSLGGPVALLPLPNNHATLVWSTTVENAAYLKSLSPKAFIAMVNAAFRLSMTDLKYMMRMERPANSASDYEDLHESELTWRLQHTPQASQVPPMVNGVQEGSVASFPLRFRHASTYISPRVALVGDAAHVIHPLAGQGLNLGMGDVASLSKTIEYAVDHGMDIGDILSLEKYTAERWAVNAKIGGVCDMLHKLYNVPGHGPVAWGRSLGLEIIDRLPFVKGFLMKNAEG